MDRGATKRIVAPGAAWTKPTVVAAAAAPVLATSGCPALTAHGSITGAGGLDTIVVAANVTVTGSIDAGAGNDSITLGANSTVTGSGDSKKWVRTKPVSNTICALKRPRHG